MKPTNDFFLDEEGGYQHFGGGGSCSPVSKRINEGAYERFGWGHSHLLISKDINPEDYTTAVVPGWLSGVFRQAKGRMESENWHQYKYFGNPKEEDVDGLFDRTTDTKYFALLRQDGKWDVFYDTTKKDTVVMIVSRSGLIPGGECIHNKKTRTIDKTSSGCSKEEVLKVFERFQQKVAEDAAQKEEERRKEKCLQDERNRAEAKRQNYRQSFFG